MYSNAVQGTTTDQRDDRMRPLSASVIPTRAKRQLGCQPTTNSASSAVDTTTANGVHDAGKL